MNETEGTTQSLCPECLKKIKADRVLCGNHVYLEKTCPTHGSFSTVIWKGEPQLVHWKRPKIPKGPPVAFHDIEKGCPYDCGLCPDHRQRSCTIILEVTDRCNLRCPLCYADSGNHLQADPSMDTIHTWFQRAYQAAGNCNIQLSGGEPTLRDDLPEIVGIGKKAGFHFIQINTNGVRAASDKDYIKDLKKAGLVSAFLQFDGVSDDVYVRLRGQKLLEEKLSAIEVFGKNDIGVVLVPTLVPGVNTRQVGEILKAALKWSPAVRAVHFQPVSYFGRHFPNNGDKLRLTLPELMRAIEIQTDGMFKVSHFKPPGCENARCSFHGNYMIMPGGRVICLQKDKTCCDTPLNAEKGAFKAISYVARQWASPLKPDLSMVSKASFGCSGSDTACKTDNSSLIRLEDFLERARTHTFSVSAMAFQDVWNLDLERVKDCCIHVMAPNGSLVPFCLYNLTAADGKKLYRP
jgi:7,8-dihydro-6-hydroxymethylpterin dimethyltransferase